MNRVAGPYSRSARRTLENQATSKPCKWCGRAPRHDRSRCPATRAPCNRCGKLGHFAAVCRSAERQDHKVQQVSHARNSPREDQARSSVVEEVAYYNVFGRELQQSGHCLVAAPLNVGTSNFVAIVDTGAQANICPLWAISALDQKKITQKQVSIRPFGSTPIQPVGVIWCKTSWQGRSTQAEWLIVDDSLLGRQIDSIISKSLALALKMIALDPGHVPFNNVYKTSPNNKTDELYYASKIKDMDLEKTKQGKQSQKWIVDERYKACFEGLGFLRGHVVHLYLKEKAKPFISPPRPHPYYLQPLIDDAISKMLQDGVIERHSGPAEWISNLAIVFKEGGNIRVTMDLRGLNSELRDTHLPIPNPDSIKAKLAGCKVFSKLDFKQAFHQLELAEESRPLTVFRCRPQLYRYKRLCMGLKPGRGSSQQRAQNSLGICCSCM